MLSYTEFREEIRERMEQRMGDRYRVDIHRIRKANAGAQDAVAIFEKRSTGSCTSPNIYLEPLYQKYKEGMGIQEIMEGAVFMYQKGMENADAVLGHMPDIREYESCRGRLYFRLAGTEKNRSLLEGVPHCEVMDLSVIPYLMVEETGIGMGSVMVDSAMVKGWGVPGETVLKQAFANTPGMLPVTVNTLLSVMEQICREPKESGGGQQDAVGNAGEAAAFPGILHKAVGFPDIFIMTNKKGLNGFAAILYPGALKSAADMIGKDLYVIPSSVHEAILVPAGSFMGAGGLLEMVREVNATCVAEEEVVSDSVYFYDREERKLCMAGEEGLCVRL